MKKILTFGAAIAAAVVLTFAVGTDHKSADAQSMGPYNKTSTRPVGHMVPVFNASDSLIFDGELVSLDTTTATSNNLRIYVRRYIPAAAARQHTLGLAVGTIAKSSQGGAGQVLIQGFHPRARLALSNMVPYAPLKVSLLTTGSLAQGDTVAGNCGFLYKYVAGGAPFKGAVWFYGGGRCAGPAL